MTTAPLIARLTPRLGRFCYLALNVAVVVFLLAPIAIVFVFALNPTPYIQFPPVGVSLRWFEKFFASRDFMNALWLSLEVAAMTTPDALPGYSAMYPDGFDWRNEYATRWVVSSLIKEPSWLAGVQSERARSDEAITSSNSSQALLSISLSMRCSRRTRQRTL